MTAGKLKILLTILLASGLFARPDHHIRFTRMPAAEGVSLNLVYCLLQDNTGYIWFGTMHGLLRYDGTRYKIYRHNPDDPFSLSFNDITVLMQDSRGDIWAGTWGGGLNRLDKSTGRFHRYLHDPDNPHSIGSNIIWSLAESGVNGSPGQIWIGHNSGLDLLTGADTIRRFKHHPDSSNSLPSGSIQSMMIDNSGRLWVGAPGGLAMRNASQNPTGGFVKPGLPSTENPFYRNITALHQDSRGQLWAGTARSGLMGFSSDDFLNGRPARHYRHNPEKSSSIAFYGVSLIDEDHDGNLWIGTYRGLSRLTVANRDAGIFESFRHSPDVPTSPSGNFPAAFCQGRGGEIWVSQYHHGIDKILPQTEGSRFYDNAAGDQWIGKTLRALAESPEGNIFAASGGELHRLTPQDGVTETLQAFQPRPEPLNLDKSGRRKIRSISALAAFEYNGRQYLAIGTARDGLIIREGNSSADYRYHHYKHQPEDSTSLRSNYVGVLSYDRQRQRLWIGTRNGLHSLLPGKRQLRLHQPDLGPQPVGTNWIQSIFADRGDTLWVGSFGGLTRYDLVNNRQQHFRHRLDDGSSLSNDYVYSIYRDQRRRLWIGTAQGLNLFDEKVSAFGVIDESDGLPNGVIYGIEGDAEGNLWLSSNSGVFRYHPDRAAVSIPKSGIRPGSLTYSPGLHLKSANGNIWFGGIGGLIQFDPSWHASTSYDAPLVLSGISNMGREVIPQATNTFRYDQNFFSFSFAALDYKEHRTSQFRYRLEGHDRDWIYGASDASARYSDLPPGSYRFRVEAPGSNGDWRAGGADFSFSITPPFWQTAWFLMLLLIGGALLIWQIYRRKLRAEVRQQLLIERTRQTVQARVREQAARDYHDVLGHQLTKISLYGALLKRELGEMPLAQTGTSDDFQEMSRPDSPGITSYVDKITGAARHLCRDARDFIWALNPEQDSLHDMIDHIIQAGQNFFEDSDITFEALPPEDRLYDIHLPMAWRQQLNLIFREAMTNVLRHSACSNAQLSWTLEKGIMEISLLDDGLGIVGEDDAGEQGNGMKSMRQRAVQLGCKIRVDSHFSEGTRITFSGALPSAAGRES